MSPRVQQDAARAPLGRPLVAAYLGALGLPDLADQEPCLDSLVALHRAHVERFAHDTVWIARGRIPALDVETMVRGLLAGEGGVCTQLGFGFSWLLRELGYDVQLHRADVQMTLDDDFRSYPQHPVLSVRIDGVVWYADVGMGNGMLDPVPCIEGPHTQAGDFTYVLEPVPGRTGMWHFRQDPRMRGVRRLQFDDRGDDALDTFADGFDQMVTAPESPFRRTIAASRRHGGGVSILADHVLTRLDETGRHRTTLHSAEEWESVLREEFLLQLPAWSIEERDRLWHRVVAGPD